MFSGEGSSSPAQQQRTDSFVNNIRTWSYFSRVSTPISYINYNGFQHYLRPSDVRTGCFATVLKFTGGQKVRNFASIFDTSRILFDEIVSKRSKISEILNISLERG